MRCPNCNVEVAENTKFCSECGTKLPELVEKVTPCVATLDEKAEVSDSIAVSEEKSKKKKRLKKIIIIAICSIFACGLVFLNLYFLNPSCMFGHFGTHYEGTNATCTEAGDVKRICNDCGFVVQDCSRRALGHEFGYKSLVCDRCGEKRLCEEAGVDHDFEAGACGIERTCKECGVKKTFQHDCNFYSGTKCMYCDSPRYTVTYPKTSTTVHCYDNSDNRKKSCTVTNIQTEYDGDEIIVTYTVKSTYHKQGNKYSDYAKFGWKLYDMDGTVIASGTASSKGSLTVGEQSKGSFTIYNVESWKAYKLEILNLSE